MTTLLQTWRFNNDNKPYQAINFEWELLTHINREFWLKIGIYNNVGIAIIARYGPNLEQLDQWIESMLHMNFLIWWQGQ